MIERSRDIIILLISIGAGREAWIGAALVRAAGASDTGKCTSEPPPFAVS